MAIREELESAPGPGDATTAAEAYEAHFALVWRNLGRLGVPRQLLDDATQDTFLVVHRRWHEFERRSELRTWILGIVLRVASDYRRFGRRLRARTATDTDVEALRVAGGAQDPESRAALREDLVLLERLLDTLPGDQREVLVMVELEELTVPEVAAVLKVNLSTCYTRLGRARERFEAALVRARRRQPRRSR